MKRSPILAGCAVVLLLASVQSAVAATPAPVTVSPNKPTSGELVVDAKKWDGKTITFTGEAITEAQERGDHAWIHINDDAYYLKNVEEGAKLGGFNSGHAVWLPRELADKIQTYGDYKHEGDVVAVSGTFNAACGEHGGDMDIHADSLEVVTPGRDVNETISSRKALFALGISLLAALLWFALRRGERNYVFGPGKQGA